MPTAQQIATLSKYGPAAVARGYNTYKEAQAYEKQKGKADFLKFAVAPAAAAFGGGTLGSMLLGGGGAAGTGAAAAGSGYSSPGVFGGLFGGGSSSIAPAAATAGTFSLGSFLSNPATALGVNAVTGILGQRAQSKANDKNIAAQMEANRRAEAMENARLAEQSRQFDVSQNDQRAALTASNEMERRKLAAAEEERAFNRRLLEEREARLAPYRQTAERARLSLLAMLGM